MKQIPLTQGKFALVDDEDYDELMKYKWYAHKKKRTYYAVRNANVSDGKRGMIAMHRFLLDVNDRFISVDHKDGNGLNNTRSNIRACTQVQNSQNAKKHSNNTSGYKGVYFNKSYGKYQAQIRISGKRKTIGYYDTAITAAKAYDELAIKHHGEFANINFPEHFLISNK